MLSAKQRVSVTVPAELVEYAKINNINMSATLTRSLEDIRGMVAGASKEDILEQIERAKLEKKRIKREHKAELERENKKISRLKRLYEDIEEFEKTKGTKVYEECLEDFKKVVLNREDVRPFLGAWARIFSKRLGRPFSERDMLRLAEELKEGVSNGG